MDLGQAREHVRSHAHAALSTVRRDGTPQPFPVTAAVDDDRAVAGEHDDRDDHRRAMLEEQRCLLLVTLVRAGPDRAG